MNVGLLVVCCLDGQVLYTYDGQWQADLWSHRMRLLHKRTWWKPIRWCVVVPTMKMVQSSNTCDSFLLSLNATVLMSWKRWWCEVLQELRTSATELAAVWDVTRSKLWNAARKSVLGPRTSFLQNEKPFRVVLFQRSFKLRYCNIFIAVNFNICFGRDPPIDLRTLDCATHAPCNALGEGPLAGEVFRPMGAESLPWSRRTHVWRNGNMEILRRKP